MTTTRRPRREFLKGILLGAAAASLPLRSAKSAGQPIRVGSTLALTGPLAQTAALHKITTEIFVEQLNKRGGLLGRPVEWVLRDDQSKPEIARSLYEQLITGDTVDLIMGPYGTNAILAAIPVAQRHGKLLIQWSLGIPKLATYDLHFPASPYGPTPETEYAKIVFDALASTPKPPKSVAIVTSKFPAAKVWSEGAAAEAKARGLHVALHLEYEFGARDFGAVAARIKDVKADFLWTGALGLDGNLLLEALKKLDYEPPLHLCLWPTPGPLVAAPEANKALSFTFFEEDPNKIEPGAIGEYISLFHERATKAGVPYTAVDLQAAGPYSAWQILEAAVTATGSLSDQALGNWLKANKVTTIFGNLSFEGKFNHGPQRMLVKQVQNGRWVTVWPQQFAAVGAKIVTP